VRFNKDFNEAEKAERAKRLEQQQTKIYNLRKERLEREKARFDNMDADF
jgi:hypothetical protein